MGPAQAYQSLLVILAAVVFSRQHWPIERRFTPRKVNLMLAEVPAAFNRVMAHMFIVYALKKPNNALEFVRCAHWDARGKAASRPLVLR